MNWRSSAQSTAWRYVWRVILASSGLNALTRVPTLMTASLTASKVTSAILWLHAIENFAVAFAKCLVFHSCTLRDANSVLSACLIRVLHSCTLS